MAETFGEDPLVNANMAIAHVTGLQGGDGSQTYLKTAATCKVRSGSGSAAVQRRLLAVGLDSVGETRRRCKVAAHHLPACPAQGRTFAHFASPSIPTRCPPICFFPPLQHFIGNDLEGWRGVTRHNFDAKISPADMRDSFMPPFEACVREAKASSFMCSYNRGGLS